MVEPLRNSDWLQLRSPPGLNEMIQRAARARGMSVSAYVRQAARAALELDGFDPTRIAPQDGEATRRAR